MEPNELKKISTSEQVSAPNPINELGPNERATAARAYFRTQSCNVQQKPSEPSQPPLIEKTSISTPSSELPKSKEIKLISQSSNMKKSVTNVKSVETMLQQRQPNPEDLLISLGFGSSNYYCNSLLRIPERFLQEQSYAKGVCVADIIQKRNSALLQESVSQSVNLLIGKQAKVDKPTCCGNHSQCGRKVEKKEIKTPKPRILVIGPERYECINSSTIRPVDGTGTADGKQSNPFDEQFRLALHSVKERNAKSSSIERKPSGSNMDYLALSREMSSLHLEPSETGSVQLENVSEEEENQSDEEKEEESNLVDELNLLAQGRVNNLTEMCLFTSFQCVRLASELNRSLIMLVDAVIGSTETNSAITIIYASNKTLLETTLSEIVKIEYMLKDCIAISSSNQSDDNMEDIIRQTLGLINHQISEILEMVKKMSERFLQITKSSKSQV